LIPLTGKFDGCPSHADYYSPKAARKVKAERTEKQRGGAIFFESRKTANKDNIKCREADANQQKQRRNWTHYVCRPFEAEPCAAPKRLAECRWGEIIHMPPILPRMKKPATRGGLLPGYVNHHPQH
jgi:hypothetical protein